MGCEECLASTGRVQLLMCQQREIRKVLYCIGQYVIDERFVLETRCMIHRGGLSKSGLLIEKSFHFLLAERNFKGWLTSTIMSANALEFTMKLENKSSLSQM